MKRYIQQGVVKALINSRQSYDRPMEGSVDVYLCERQLGFAEGTLKCSNLFIIYKACSADDQCNPSDYFFTATCAGFHPLSVSHQVEVLHPQEFLPACAELTLALK